MAPHQTGSFGRIARLTCRRHGESSFELAITGSVTTHESIPISPLSIPSRFHLLFPLLLLSVHTLFIAVLVHWSLLLNSSITSSVGRPADHAGSNGKKHAERAGKNPAKQRKSKFSPWIPPPACSTSKPSPFVSLRRNLVLRSYQILLI
jgi:hypothetical protein